MPKNVGKTSKPKPEGDARGQFKQSQHGSHNDGVSSADPEALSKKKSGDATFSDDPKERSTPRE